MNRSRAFQGFSVALLAVTGSLASTFAGCGGGPTSSSSSGGGTSTAAATTSATTGASTSGSGGAGGSSGETTASASSASSASSSASASSSGAGGMEPCAGCSTVAALPAGSAPYGLAVDGSNVYWTNSGTNEIMQAKADGSVPVTLATMQSTPFAVHVAGGFVYWTSYSVDGVMRKTPIGGGTITDLIAAPATRDFAVGTTHIWWSREPDDMQRVPIEGIVGDAGTPDLLTGNPLSNGVTADATSVYWVNRQDGNVRRSDLDFANDLALASGDVPWDIEVDATSVYWTEEGSSPKVGKVMKASKVDGSMQVTIAMAQASPQGIAIDAVSVYWANKGDGTIHKAPLAGGADTVLASGQMAPANVAVDAKYVYWTDPKADLVVRVAK